MTIARATIAGVTDATGNGRTDRDDRDHGDREAYKKKQLANKPRERRGVRRTSHVRRELCELKRRGASRLYHRVDGRQRRLTRQPRSQRQQSATDATDAE